jgi:periplasmic mercuric ion binding protein
MNKIFLLILGSVFSGALLAEEQQVTLSVPSMNCITCPITVQKALKKVDGVISAEVSYKTRQAIVVFDDSATNTEALIAATTNAGYPSTATSDAPNE